MFNSLFNLGLRRTDKQAFGFYLVMFLFMFVIVGIILCLAITAGAAGEQDIIQFANTIGIPIVALLASILAIAIVHAKGLFKSPYCILMILLTMLLSLYGGVLLGLIPVAHLTTRSSESTSQQTNDK